MRIFKKLLVVITLISLVSSCRKEPFDLGYWEYNNETSLSCTIRIYTDRDGKTDFVNLQIPAGEMRSAYNVAYDGGSCVLYMWRFASIEFSDGARIDYTLRDGQIGNPLVEANYDIQRIDGQFRLALRITNAVYEAAIKQKVL